MLIELLGETAGPLLLGRAAEPRRSECDTKFFDGLAEPLKLGWASARLTLVL